MEIIEIAKICHQVNKAYCESQGDFSSKEWGEAAYCIQESVIDGVKFHLKNPGASPGESHENWLEFKKEDAWTYGKIKSKAFRTHPCCLPFEELPKTEQAKDYIFKAIVEALYNNKTEKNINLGD